MNDDRDAGSKRDKLIKRKQEWARTGRLLTDEPAVTPERRRLPPGQHRVVKWPVLDLGTQPNLPPKDWKFAVAGAVENRFTWDWETLLAQPQVEMRADIHCVTAWSLFDSAWKGVAARHVLAVARPRPEACFLVFHAYDGYTTNVPLAHFDAEDALLAHTWNGQPLTREHGGPVRVVIPRLYFWKSAKWVKQITFLEKDAPGYWEARGYHNVGDPWKQERYG